MLVLIAEDNSLLAFMLEDALTAHGHRVLGPALSVEDALELVATDRPALALVDVDLEGPRSGIDLVRELHECYGIPSLFATGQLAQVCAGGTRALGVLAKPFSPDDAVAAVDAVAARLASHQAEPWPAIPNLTWFTAANEGWLDARRIHEA
ncbi:response regulator [Frateuria sp. GZRR33]|uniref:response regulator n=1 Tax=Frateuria sp. GZRR33 TaxID=3351535 RepID=UPI003EDBC19A